MEELKLKNSLMLLLTATIWGVSFVAQSVGMEYVQPFTFNCIRCLIGALALLLFLRVSGRKQPAAQKALSAPQKRTLLIGGVSCGLALCAASSFQQFGIQYTTVGKAGFITACYIVIVPLLGLFLGKKCAPLIWGAVALALVGLYLLCIDGKFTMGLGDLLVLICAFLFSVHILIIDHFSPLCDGVKLSCIQFLVCGSISGVLMLIFESPSLVSLLHAWAPILYTGVLSCGVAYTLQVVAQKGMNPTVASLILSLESCISLLAGWVILHQTLSAKELLGCAIMFGAILLAQVPAKTKVREPEALEFQ